MRIIILGAGAIGSVYGARLSKQHDVTLIGGAPHVAAIQHDGLIMQGHLDETLRIPASTTVDTIEPGTLILLTAKANSNAAAVAPIVDRLPPDVTIVCVQNGLYAQNVVKDLVGDRALVLRAITQVGGVLVRPGVVDNTVQGYTLLEAHPRSGPIAEILTAAGLDGRPPVGRSAAALGVLALVWAAVGTRFPSAFWNHVSALPIAVTCGLTFTFGGLKTTAEGEVVSTDGHPIPGLFAAGELVGGLFYHNYPGGTGLVSGAVLGKLAGDGAGAYVKGKN